MNIVVITEGKGERYLYKSWIPLVDSNLTFVDFIRDISTNNFAIVSVFGYGGYRKRIPEIIEDINSHGNIDRLVISADSEDNTYQEKLDEISEYINGKPCIAKIFIVIQHFCIETWALGNRKVCPVNTSHQPLRTYKKVFDVRSRDPELLPAYATFNRAHFALAYLRALLNFRYRNIGYNKAKPKALCHRTYFHQICLRYQTTNHIPSFGAFLKAFV